MSQLECPTAYLAHQSVNQTHFTVVRLQTWLLTSLCVCSYCPLCCKFFLLLALLIFLHRKLPMKSLHWGTLCTAQQCHVPGQGIAPHLTEASCTPKITWACILSLFIYFLTLWTSSALRKNSENSLKHSSSWNLWGSSQKWQARRAAATFMSWIPCDSLSTSISACSMNSVRSHEVADQYQKWGSINIRLHYKNAKMWRTKLMYISICLMLQNPCYSSMWNGHTMIVVWVFFWYKSTEIFSSMKSPG